jgi:hypothetical protein
MAERITAQPVAGVVFAGDRSAKGIDTHRFSTQPDLRDVTLIEAEILEALRHDHDITLDQHAHRRNLMTRDVPRNHLAGPSFFAGEALAEGGRLDTHCC